MTQPYTHTHKHTQRHTNTDTHHHLPSKKISHTRIFFRVFNINVEKKIEIKTLSPLLYAELNFCNVSNIKIL